MKLRTKALIVLFVVFLAIEAFVYYDNVIATIIYALAGLIATDFVYLLNRSISFLKFLFFVSLVILSVYTLNMFIGVDQSPFLVGYWITIVYNGWCRLKE